ncbi:uncharacterized protein MONBRDRAFT_30686, partial [Monosiga brevicollis MX1]
MTTEKLGRSDKTTFEADLEQLMQQIDVMKSQTEKMIKATNTWLEPNPNRRLEASLAKRFSRGSTQRATELEALGLTCLEAAEAFGAHSHYAQALAAMGRVDTELGERWHHLTAVVNERFQTPMRTFISSDIKNAN